MTLIVTLDLGMSEWNFDSLQIFFGFCEMAAGLTKSSSRAMRYGFVGVTLPARVNAGEKDLESKGQKGNLHWSTHQTVPPKNVKITSICSQISMFYALTVQAVLRASENQECSVGSLLLHCSKIMLPLLVRWVSEISHILKKAFLN